MARKGILWGGGGEGLERGRRAIDLHYVVASDFAAYTQTLALSQQTINEMRRFKVWIRGGVINTVFIELLSSRL